MRDVDILWLKAIIDYLLTKRLNFTNEMYVRDRQVEKGGKLGDLIWYLIVLFHKYNSG